MTRKTNRLLTFSIVLILSALLAACGDNGNNNADNSSDNGENNNNNADDLELGEKDMTLGTDDYVSNTSNTYVAKLLLEDLGYDVDVEQTDVGVEYTGLAEGDTDALVGAWLPTTHKEYWDEYEDKLEKINTVTEDVKLSLTVPTYMEDIDSIEDLADNKNDIGEKMDWEITGISPGAGEMQIMEDDVMPGYGLDDDWNLKESSGGAMAADLGSAIDQEEPIVVTLWEPHWTYNEYDLKKLDDPKEEFGEPDDVMAVAKKEFKDDSPAAYELLSQFEMTQEDTQDIMLDIQNDEDEEDAAQNFIDDNPDLEDEWLKGLDASE